jgi:uncharacterized DUF497 family protein
VITFDPAKSERNRALCGLPFELASEFEFETATINEDSRFRYPEVRYLATGMLRGALCSMVFSRLPNGFRVISLRTASRKERHRWRANQILG